MKVNAVQMGPPARSGLSLALALGLASLGTGCSNCSSDKPTTTSAADTTGVAECDEYIAKYEACIEKSPGPTKEGAKQAFKAQRDSFKAAAASPAGKASLKKTCKQLTEGLSQNPLCK